MAELLSSNVFLVCFIVFFSNLIVLFCVYFSLVYCYSTNFLSSLPLDISLILFRKYVNAKQQS
jgi:hypothetical protein